MVFLKKGKGLDLGAEPPRVKLTFSGTLRCHDGDDNGNGQKAIGLD